MTEEKKKKEGEKRKTEQNMRKGKLVDLIKRLLKGRGDLQTEPANQWTSPGTRTLPLNQTLNTN